MRNWQLLHRDKSGVVQGRIADFNQFDAIPRRRDVGSWSVRLPAGEVADELSQPGAGLVLGLEKDDSSEVDEIIAGPVTMIEPSWSEDENVVIISGLSDEQLLWDRIVYPSAADWDAGDDQAFGQDSYDVLTGISETVLKHFFAFNALGSDRLVEDAPILGLGPDKLRGSEVTGRGRFQMLGDLLQELAIAGGDLNFFIRELIFDVAEPRHLEMEQVFSAETGNVIEVKGKILAPRATHVLVAGGGELELRHFRMVADEDAAKRWSRRIESFKDRRDTTEPAELDQTGHQELLDKAEVASLDIRVIDRPNRQYGKDWNVGDYASVNDIDCSIGQAQITLDSEGQTITPKVDSVTTTTARSVLRLFDELRVLRRRIAFLERSQ